MPTLHNILDPTPGGRVQPRDRGMGYLERSGRHWGEDLSAAVYNTPGDPVSAPAAYRVVWSGWLDGTHAARIPWHSGQAAYLDLGVWGGDRMYLLVCHLEDLYVRTGQAGPAGDLIGTMGGSGWDDGPDPGVFTDHVHLGVAQNTSRPERPALRPGQPGWIDPLAWFDRHGVDLDNTPTAHTITPASIERTWFDMATKEDLRDIIREEAGAAVWDHLIPSARTGEPTHAGTFLRWTRAVVEDVDAGVLAARKIAEAIAEKSGIDPAEVEAIIREAIAEGLAAGVELEATLTVKEDS